MVKKKSLKKIKGGFYFIKKEEKEQKKEKVEKETMYWKHCHIPMY